MAERSGILLNLNPAIWGTIAATGWRRLQARDGGSIEEPTLINRGWGTHGLAWQLFWGEGESEELQGRYVLNVA